MLNVGILGCGLIATKKHIPAFLRLKRSTKVVALCDLNEENAKTAAKKFHIDKVYTDFSQMLSEENLDLVDICTPPQTHAKLTVEALKNGAHVLLEKPIALTLSDCDMMIEAQSKYGKKICVMHNQLFNPAFIKAKHIFTEGKIGDFLGLKILLSTPTDYMTSKEDHWAHKLPGGVMGETGPHAVYMALSYLQNIYDVKVHARKCLPQYPWSNFEDFRITLIAENGFASIVLIYGSNQWAGEVEIFGSKGILKVDLEARSVVEYYRPTLRPFSIGTSVVKEALQLLGTTISNSFKYVINTPQKDAHSIGICKFVQSILNEQPSPVPPEEGKEVLRVMEMLVKAIGS